MKLSVPNYAEKTIKTLTDNGFSAYFIGGCVRDALLKKEPLDWDITTNATPKQVSQLFPKYFETGIKHGTVTVLTDGFPVEITTFRVDSNYADNRHPESVVFAQTLEEDVKRRDFTMNAIGYNKQEGLVDYTGGVDDIKARTIRCVGEPDKRFQEDALRIMRAVRFAAVLGFDIEEDTYNAILKTDSF